MNHRPKNIKIQQALTAGNVARQFDDRLLDGERPTSVVTPKNAPKWSVPTAQARPVALNFAGIHFRVGHLKVDCLNATIAEWLQLAVTNLSPRL